MSTSPQCVPIDCIVVGPRLRVASPEAAAELARSIAAQGLLNPITVRPLGEGRFALVAGLHRLEAARSLGWEEVPAVLFEGDDATAELAEIDENLVRAELTVLERAEHLARRKALYEALHPEAATRPKGGRTRKNGATVAPFSADAAERTGMRQRSVQQDLQIADGLGAEARSLLRGTPLANMTRVLLALAKVKEPDQQRRVAELLANGQAASVATALRQLSAGQGEPAASPQPAPQPEPPPDPTDILRLALAYRQRFQYDFIWIAIVLDWWLQPRLSLTAMRQRYQAHGGQVVSAYRFLVGLEEPLCEIAPGMMPKDFITSQRAEIAARFGPCSPEDEESFFCTLWHAYGDDGELREQLFDVAEHEAAKARSAKPHQVLYELAARICGVGTSALYAPLRQMRAETDAAARRAATSGAPGRDAEAGEQDDGQRQASVA